MKPKNWLSLITITTSTLGLLSASSLAQVIPDNTLGAENSTINSINESRSLIKGGAIRNENLFHSFQEFNIGKGSSVYFANPDGIANILSRVTGNNISEILGTLGVEGRANLFFINPNGIIFGKNASLDLSGSFVASTANQIEFADGTSFLANGDEPKVTLSIEVPIGLGFGSNPGNITVRGTGNNLSIPIPEFDIVRDNRPVGLEAGSGQTFGLLGGDITLEGGNLTAPEGRIELGSVGEGQTVSLTPTDSGWKFNYDGVNGFQDISLLQEASIDTSGDSSGAIQLRGREINVLDGSAILSNTLGKEGIGDGITVKSDVLNLSGVTSDRFVSVIASDNIDGTGGNLNIETEQLFMADGSQIRAIVFGSGTTGELNINANNIEVTGVNPLNFDYLTSVETSVAVESTGGRGRDVNINTKDLLVSAGGRILTDTFGFGEAGNLIINAESIELIELKNRDLALLTGLSTSARRGSRDGNAGDIVVNTNSLKLINGAGIRASTSSVGNGGNISLNAQNIELSGINPISRRSGSRISATSNDLGKGGDIIINANNLTLADIASIGTNTRARGNAGNININTNTLKLSDGSQIRGFTTARGNAGNINVNAKDVEVVGIHPFEPSSSSIITTSSSRGNAGDIRITTESLRVADGARIFAATFNRSDAAGNAGDINIAAKDIEITGSNPSFPKRFSGISTSSLFGKGNGGNITFTTESLKVADGSQIRAISSGLGNAGRIDITAKKLENNNGIITATSEQTGGGQIDINTNQITLDNQGEINTSVFDGAGNGGDITINSDTFTAFNSSRVTANAFQGSGGNILIDTSGYFVSNDFVISASSEFGLDGVITINTPDNDLQKDLNLFNLNFSPTEKTIQSSCSNPNRTRGRVTFGGGSAFALSSDSYYSETDLRLNFEASPQTPIEKTLPEDTYPQETGWKKGDPIVPANKVVYTPDGRAFLVASSPQAQDLACQAN